MTYRTVRRRNVRRRTVTRRNVRHRTKKRGGGLSPLSPTPHVLQKSKIKSKKTKTKKHNYLKQALLFSQRKAGHHLLETPKSATPKSATPKSATPNKTQRKPVNFKKLDSLWSQRIEKELADREKNESP